MNKGREDKNRLKVVVNVNRTEYGYEVLQLLQKLSLRFWNILVSISSGRICLLSHVRRRLEKEPCPHYNPSMSIQLLVIGTD